jgi:hypothetical protein
MKISEKELQGLIPNIRGLVDPKVETRINEAFRRVYEYMLLKLDEQGKSYQDQIKSLQDASAGVNQQLNTLVGAYSQPLIGGTPDPLLQNFSSQFGPQNVNHFLGGPEPKFRPITSGDISTAVAGLPAKPANQLEAEGTILDVNLINDGEFLKRVGSTVVSGNPASAALINPTEKILPVRRNNVFADSHFTEDSVITTAVLPAPFTAFWSLSDLVDAIGGRVLTNQNNVPFVDGKIGKAAQFASASNQNLFCPLDAGIKLNPGQSWCLSFWFKRVNITGSENLMVGTDANGTGFYVIIQTNQTEQFYQLQNSDYSFFVQGNTVNNTNWHHCLVWQDIADNKIRIRVDNNPTIVTSGTARAMIASGAGSFQIAPASFNGLIDMVGIGQFAPTTAQQDALWNSGNGYEANANFNIRGNLITANADQFIINGRDLITRFPYSAMVTNSTAQQPAINGWRDVIWDTTIFDSWSMHGSGGANRLLSAIVTGSYLVKVYMLLPPTGPSGMNFGVSKNDAIGSIYSQNSIVNTSGNTVIQASAIVAMNAGDYASVHIYETQAQPIPIAGDYPYFSMSRIG